VAIETGTTTRKPSLPTSKLLPSLLNKPLPLPQLKPVPLPQLKPVQRKPPNKLVKLASWKLAALLRRKTPHLLLQQRKLTPPLQAK
jgi:hypothetical protein